MPDGRAPADDAETQVRPLDGRGRWLRVAPFVLITAVGLGLGLAEPDYADAAVIPAIGILALMVLAVGVLPWSRWPVGWQAVPILGIFPISALLGYAAGEHTEFIFLTVLPVVWLVLYHTRRWVLAGVLLLASTLFLPLVLLPGRISYHWNDTIMAFLLAGFGGLAISQLVARSRTAVVQAAAASRRAQADRDLLTAYLDNAGAIVVVVNREGRVTLFNRFAEQATGYREEDLLGQTLWEMNQDPGGARQAFQAILDGEPLVRFAGDWVIRSGEVRRFAWTSTGLVGDGRVTHVIGNGVDITDKINTQKLLANVLAAATEHMIAATDRHGTFTVFNVGAEKLLGYRADEMIGVRTVVDIHLPEELQALADQAGVPSFQTLLDNPPPDEDVVDIREWTLVRKDGSHVPVSMAVQSMRDEGRLVGYVITAQDISAERAARAATDEALARERQAAERLRELDQVKNDFVATVSHDLRTPLTSIVGNAELILDGDAGDLNPMLTRLVAAIDRNARRLDTLVGDLLLLSRIESGTLRMDVRPVAVREVIDGTLEAVAARRRGDTEVSVSTPADPVLVQGDLAQLERVTTNLLSNALKFTPPGGRVEVRVEADRPHVRITVSDTGIGIPAEELPHVFERFFRSSRSQKQKRPGTGLGLTIAKSIVEHHGGTIEVHGNPSGGTTFMIQLPRLAADAEDLAETSPKEPA